MSTWYMLLREWRFRAGNALLGGAAVALAVAVWSGSLVILRGHDARTAVGLDLAREQAAKATAELEDGMRRATLKLSFNLVILPEGQDLRAWHNDGEIRGTLPEAYVRQLADSGIATIQHLLPIVQRRLLWEEKGRRIILVGTRGEVAQLHSNPKKPLVQPVPPGRMPVARMSASAAAASSVGASEASAASRSSRCSANAVRRAHLAAACRSVCSAE